MTETGRQLGVVADALRNAPVHFAWVWDQAANPEIRQRWFYLMIKMAVILFAGWLAELLVLENNPKSSTELCQKIEKLKVETGQRTGDVNMQRVLAMVAEQETPHDWNKVDEHMTESFRLAKERGARPELAVTHFRYAELLQQKSDLPKAREQLNKASALFSEMEMNWWLEQAEALRKNLAVG